MAGQGEPLTEATGPRPAKGPRVWGPRVQPDQDHAFNPYRLTLASLIYPAWKHCLIGVFRAGCLALLGHLSVALVWLAASCLTDIVMQRLVNAWDRAAADSGASETPLRVALLCGLRSSLYMSAPVLVTLQTHQPQDFLFLTLMACSMVAFSLSYGAFSKPVFWAMALPPLVGFLAIAVALFAPVHAAVIVASVVFTIVVMAMVWTTWRDAMAGWRSTHNASLDMIQDLRAARDRALAERIAADEAREIARRAGQAKANFLASMSHEIRTPMNGVLGMAEVLRRTATGPEQVEQLQMLTASGDYLLTILNDILDMSKIDAGRLEMMFEPEDLRQFLEQVAAFWRPQAEAKGLTLALNIEETVPRFVNVDAVRLRQVLFNLIGNAVKHTETGSVTLTARAGPLRQGRTRVFINVIDTGPGIPAEVLPVVFDRFAQTNDVATRRFGGNGLGLAISQQITELMGGRLRAESPPGLGATFHLELVLEVLKFGSAPRATDPTRQATDSMRPLKILAVDDNAVNLSVLERMLGQRGHKVTAATGGSQALELAMVQAFDVVLMDIHMPEMSGPETLKALRAADGPNRRTPIIALTADVVSGNRASYQAQGFFDLATKPIEPPSLFGALRRATDRPTKASGAKSPKRAA